MTPTLSSTEMPSIATNPSWIEIVRQRVGELRFGTVQITVHDGRVTQVDSTQRTRLPLNSAPE